MIIINETGHSLILIVSLSFKQSNSKVSGLVDRGLLFFIAETFQLFLKKNCAFIFYYSLLHGDL